MIRAKELIGMYATGWFPMATPDGEIRLFSPDPRGILPLDGFHIPHGTRQVIKDPRWDVRIDTAFQDVVQACADRKETWIDDRIFASYRELHRVGRAHSVEVWREGQLAGGLYGVRLGAAFFGESMFHHHSGASKVALVALVDILTAGGFRLLDIQWVTPHLRRFGAMEVSKQNYLGALREALQIPGIWPSMGPWARGGDQSKISP
ncbi:MAG: leucyl/phenylalanyl-tRNA--protein transferase [Terrimicrobiaceae bacterium]